MNAAVVPKPKRRIAIGQHILKSPYQKPINARQNANVHNNIILQCGLLSLFFLFFMLAILHNFAFNVHMKYYEVIPLVYIGDL